MKLKLIENWILIFMKYKIKDNDIILRLENGDEIINSLKTLAQKENIDFAQINGIGAVNQVEIGLYDFDKKKYRHKVLDGEYELTSLMGNISLKDNEPFVHLHVTLSDYKYSCLGGHLFKALITATCEIIIRVINQQINRSKDDLTDLDLWDLDSCG